MRSRFLAILSSFLLLTALLLIFAWIHSTSSFDEFSWTGQSHLRLISFNSSLSLRLVTFPDRLPIPRPIHWYQSDYTTNGIPFTSDPLDRPPYLSEPASHLSFLGLDFQHAHWSSPIAKSFELTVPYWLAIFFTALPAIIHLSLLFRRQRLANTPPTRCKFCGHDLSTSKNLCPECGTPIPLPNAPL